MKIRTILCSAAVLMAAGAPLQSNAQVTEGQRVRIVSPANGYHEPTGGTVMLVMPDSIVLGIRTLQHTIALEDIDRLQVSAGKNARLSEVGIGLLAGATTGFAVGWLQHTISGPLEGEAENNPDEDLRPMFLVGGTVIGALVGLLGPGDRWTSVPVNFSAGPHGAGVVLSHRF